MSSEYPLTSDRHRIEAALRGLDLALEHVSEAVLVVDTEDRTILACNAAVERVFGYTADEIQDRPTRLLHLDDERYHAFQEQIRPALERGETWSGRFWMRRKSGTAFPTRQLVTPVVPGLGLRAGVVKVIRDVSEVQSAVRRAEIAEENFQHLLARMPVPVAVHRGATVLWANQALASLLGRADADGLEGQDLRDLIAFEDSGAATLSILRCIALGEPAGPVEVTARPADRRLHLELTSLPTEYSGEQVIQTVIRDLTHEREARAAVESREEYHRTLVENALDVTTVLDADGTIRYESPAVKAVLGYDGEHLVGQNAFEFIHPEDAGAVRTTLERAEREPTAVVRGEFRFRARDGSYRVLETRARNLLHHPLIRGFVVNSRDVTEQRAAERDLRMRDQELLQVQKMEAVGSLAGGIAHDFNNWLTAIAGHAELLRTADSTDAGRRHATGIIEAVQRAAGLTRQLLLFSRRRAFHPETLDPNGVVRSIERLLARLIEANVTIEYELADDPGMVRLDPVQYEQIIMNLVVNARDAMPGGGSIRVRTERYEGEIEGGLPRRPVGDWSVLVVTDEGEGISPELLSRVFDPFFSTKAPGRGTGLGLATVQRIAEGAGGTAVVESRPGAGTTFRIYLPAVAGPVEERETVSVGPTPPPGSGQTILVAEDEPGVRALAGEILRGAGYRVVLAADGPEAEAAAAARADGVDLLLTDLLMPGFDGVELARRLRAANSALPVLFMTGYADDGIRSTELTGPRLFRLEKPFLPDDLLRWVHQALR